MNDPKKVKLNIIRNLINMLFGGITAFVVLNIIAYFVYSVPVKVVTPVRSTDFVMEQNYTGYIMDEGIAKIRTDHLGYNNAPDLDVTKVNILVMGSSHTLGYNVHPNSNYSRVLSDRLNQRGFQSVDTVYNMGMWGHTWYTQANNITDAIALVQPSDYIIMEVHDSLGYSAEKVAKVITNDYPREGTGNGRFVTSLKSVPFLKLGMHQVKNMLASQQQESSSVYAMNEDTTDISESYYENLCVVMCQLKETADALGVKLIILYHPHLILDNEVKGQAWVVQTEYRNFFEDACCNNGIVFCDMTDTFLEAYSESYIVPYGFANTEIGEGHLNEWGHELVADVLCEAIVTDMTQEGVSQ